MKYAIFDLDGTIVDSMEYWRGATAAFLKNKGYELKEDIRELEKTKGIEGTCQYFCEKFGLNITPRELMEWAINYVVSRYTEKVDFKPGARQLLDNLSQSGVKMCICSSTDRWMMEPVLKRLDIDKYFCFTEHCRRYGKEKNEPDIFLDCMHRLGADEPGQVAVFEDALYSASTAKNTGFYVVGMYDKTEKNTDELAKLADQYVTDYNELNYSVLPE